MNEKHINAKVYLMNIRKLDNQVKNKNVELTEVFKRIKNLKGTEQEKLIDEYVEYQNELETSIKQLVSYKQETMNLIDKIHNADCVDVLYKRYFQFKKWEQIAVEMNYAYRTVLRIHGQALKEFESLLKVGTQCHIN